MTVRTERRSRVIGISLLIPAVLCWFLISAHPVRAQETDSPEQTGSPAAQTDAGERSGENQLFFSEDGEEISLTPGYESESGSGQEDQGGLKGTYQLPDGWTEIRDKQQEGDKVTLKRSGSESSENTSVITCDYMDTNYSVLEYEQLREMLTNNLVYNHVNAQITSQACYTDAKDYLYILIVDDSAQDCRELYYYVVGDRRCFVVEAKEYRAEAEQLRSEGQKTPEETAQDLAESFTWNSAG